MIECEKFNWNKLANEFDQSILSHIPNTDLFNKFKKDFPNLAYYGYVMDSDLQEIKNEALKKSYKEIERIRYDGLITHAHAHSRAYNFLKTLHIFQNHFIHYPKIFKESLNNQVEKLEKKYENIFKILIKNIDFIKNEDGIIESSFYVILSKKDKNTLIKAFWNDFENCWNEFNEYDWLKEYENLWNYQYEIYKDNIKN